MELEKTRALLGAIREGRREAAEELFARYYDVAIRIAEFRMGRRLRGRYEVEDVVQESLLDAFQALDGFDFRSDGCFRNWMARIIENNVRDLDRRDKAVRRGEGRERLRADLSRTSLRETFFPGNEPTPSQVAMGAEAEERIEIAIHEQLRGPYREVLMLRNLCGMSYAEVAQEMGYGRESTVRALHSRAMGKLSEHLDRMLS